MAAKYSKRVFLAGAIFLLLLFIGLSFLKRDVRWRFAVLDAKAAGKIPEIPFFTLFSWLRPGTPVYLEGLATVPNVNAAIANDRTTTASAENGARIFSAFCQKCHGEKGQGAAGPNLISRLRTSTDWSFFSTVKWGRINTAMTRQPISDAQIWDVETFLKTIDRDRAKGPAHESFDPVTPDMLAAAQDSRLWLTHAGSYAGYRFSPATEINRDNVRRLALVWAAQLSSDSSALQATPIVSKDKMFVTESPGSVVALDPRTGNVDWEFRRPVPAGLSLCCGSQNRGVAVLNKTVFLETLDAHLVALDAETGQKKWDVAVADPKKDYSMTGAPLALADSIVVGVSGGDFGAKGFLVAYSEDGSLRWRFNTVPEAGEPGYETWGNALSSRGGAATWNVGAYDPTLGLIYWGTGNPTPMYDTTVRPGANLYSDSVVALDARSGKLRWYYQFTPSDDHDWDSAEQPVLADIPWEGRQRRVLLMANRNGFFYALDRETGQFLAAHAFARQNWANGFTPEGRPIVRPEAHPNRTGSLVWPSVEGATNWWAPSYIPQERVLLVPRLDAASIYFSSGMPRFTKGEQFYGSASSSPAGESSAISVAAIDTLTGNIKWNSVLDQGGAEVNREMSGLLSTAGGLVFGGYKGEFLALDSHTGKQLWRISLGGPTRAPAISYEIDGRQFISVVSGRTLFTFGLN